MSAVALAAVLPDPARLEAAFAVVREPWGVRHGAADSAGLFALLLLRWVAVLLVCPFLGGRLVPGPVKIGLAAAMAWFSAPWLSQRLPVPLGLSPLGWWGAALHELAIGLLVGFGSSLVFYAATMAGELVDSTRGALTANLLVPQLQTQASPLADFYFQLFVVLYLLAGGHLYFLSAVLESYQVFPPTGGLPGALVVHESFLAMTLSVFGIMVKVAAPAIVVLLFADVVLGLANRATPQMEVFFLGLGLKPAVGVLVVALSLYALPGPAREAFAAFHAWLVSWLHRG